MAISTFYTAPLAFNHSRVLLISENNPSSQAPGLADMDPSAIVTNSCGGKQKRAPEIVEHVVLPIREAVDSQTVVLVHEGTQRHTHRNDCGACAGRCYPKHDHDLILCSRDRVTACQDLASHHSRDKHKPRHAQHVDEWSQRRAEDLLERRPAQP